MISVIILRSEEQIPSKLAYFKAEFLEDCRGPSLGDDLGVGVRNS